MEIECCKCGRKFSPTREGIAVCPECLKQEFAASAPRLKDSERAALAAEYAPSIKRQTARAAAMGQVYASGHAFNVAGTLRLALGIGIFAVCAFIFLISDKDSGVTFLTDDDIETQRVFSMVFCSVAAVVIATAPVYYKKLTKVLAVCVLLLGWFMPNMLEAALDSEMEKKRALMAENAPAGQQIIQSEGGGAVLTNADLQVFYSQKTASHRISHYAIYMDKQDSRSRDILRDALGRLLQAEYTRAYSRANGALFVCSNVPGERRNISSLLNRFGTITYAVPDKGVYEVDFDMEKANLVSQYSPEVLSSPMHASYVTANLSELRCFDPIRVRMAARSLANSNVQVLRGEIRRALLDVLNDPWASEPDTYAALIDAIVVYSNASDKESTQQCYKYFQARHALKREVNKNVIRFLILQTPDTMASPVVELWSENSVEWGEMLNLLGFRAQAILLSKLKATDNIRLIGAILKYIEKNGTKDALPAVEPFLDYSDSIIRHAARSAVEALQAR